jgi:hypothetical protein
MARQRGQPLPILKGNFPDEPSFVGALALGGYESGISGSFARRLRVHLMDLGEMLSIPAFAAPLSFPR